MAKSLIEVILLHDFRKKGKFGDLTKVKRGYAKNFLIPNKFALYASKDNLKKFDEMKAKALQESEALRSKALEIMKKIEEIKISIVRQSAQDNKIFGTVNSRDIINELKKSDIDIQRNSIVINDQIKYLGIYKVQIILHPDVILEKDIFVVNAAGSIANITKAEEERNEIIESASVEVSSSEEDYDDN